jgi:hypothetical protein
MKPIEKLIDNHVECLRCGTKGFMKCDCHIQCDCGWIYYKEESCGNPECGTKGK